MTQRGKGKAEKSIEPKRSKDGGGGMPRSIMGIVKIPMGAKPKGFAYANREAVRERPNLRVRTFERGFVVEGE